MRRCISMVSVVVAVSMAAACGRSSGSAGQSSTAVVQAGSIGGVDKAADEAMLRAIYQKFPTQITAKDTASIAALFMDDGVEVTPGMSPAQGHAAISKTFASLFAAQKNLEVSFGDLTITVADAGDVGVIKAPYRMTFTDLKGKKGEDHGTTLTVFRKVNGQWKMLYDSNISEVPAQ
jgi:uncharacterized protein (TIGR02246 family)